MATVAFPTQQLPSKHYMTKASVSFKGDQDGHIDQLIVASMKPNFHDHELRSLERKLVPFDFGADVSQFEPLQKRAPQNGKTSSQPIPTGKKPHPNPHHGLKRTANDRSTPHLTDGTTGSPPKKENQVTKAKHNRRGGNAKNGGGTTTSPPTPKAPGAAKSKKSPNTKNAAATAADHASGAHSDGEVSARSSHNNNNNNNNKGGNNGRPPRPASKSTAAGPVRMDTSAPSSNEGTPSKGSNGQYMTNGMAQRVSKYAGPAFTNSPMPDSLPIPTTSLLMQEAADKLRSRLML